MSLAILEVEWNLPGPLSRSRLAVRHGMIEQAPDDPGNPSVAKTSAGLLPYRRRDGRVEVFLVHPGGPFWARKDMHAWSVAKGEVEPGEDLLAAAHREFLEETGITLKGSTVALAPVRQSGGKLVHVWAVEAELDPAALVSNTFPLEWPPHSGRITEVPEVDRADWFDLAEAATKIHKGQIPLLADLRSVLGG